MRTLFRTSTAILTSLSLAVPLPALAQQPTQQVPTCADGSVPPCPNREEAKTPDQRAAEELAEKRKLERAEQRKEERKAAAQAEKDAAAQAERDAATRKERDSADKAARDAARDADKAARDAAKQADRETAAQAEREAAAQADRDAAIKAERDAAAQAEREAARQREAEGRAVSTPPAIQPQGGTTEAVPTGEAAQPRPMPRRDGTTVTDSDRPISAPETPTPDERTRRQERREQRELEAARNEPDRSVASTDGTETGEVVTETVTADEVRTSNEDFETSAGATASSDRKSGLSDLEKALLIGAGALVVGGLIRNSNKRVVSNSGDRVVVENDGSFEVIKDDNALLRQPGSDVRTETFSDGSSRQTITRTDGSKIVTIRDSELRVLRRVRVEADGRQTVLFDDTQGFQPVDVSTLPPPAPRPSVSTSQDNDAVLRAALAAESRAGRRFSLAQVRGIERVRELVPPINLDNVTFATGSAAITPDQARTLSDLGRLMVDEIARNPREIFLIEGHTDAVGSEPYNLALSDRRAETVALALTEYFHVPPENMIVQGYGESYLRVQTEAAERANRRVTVRRITPLLQEIAAN